MRDGSGQQRWVVLGASGFVGGHVVEAARAAGHEVVGTTAPRLSSAAVTAADVARDAAGLLAEQEALLALFRDADVVVNAAGLATPDAVTSSTLVGANAVLPLVVAVAASRAGVRRFVHLSSAAVQGARARLDETESTAPFSPYSTSKALGEMALVARRNDHHEDVVVIRATSVQGAGRPTTERLRSLSRSPLASVAAPGTAPSPVTSVSALAEFVVLVGERTGSVPAIVLQPWEGMTVSSVLEAAGGRRPRHLPAGACRLAVRAARVATRLAGGRGAGAVRRVELMWFGQDQVPGWAADAGVVPEPRVAAVLRGGDR